MPVERLWNGESQNWNPEKPTDQSDSANAAYWSNCLGVSMLAVAAKSMQSMYFSNMALMWARSFAHPGSGKLG